MGGKMKFVDGFEKIAGIKSEVVGSVIHLPTSLVTGLGGLTREPHSKEVQEDVDKASWSNIFIPGLAAYRLARRKGEDKNKEKK